LGLRFAHLDYRKNPKALTIGSLVALALGLIVGIATQRSQDPQLLGLLSFLEPFATVWLHALQMVVIPLMVSHLVVAIASKEASPQAGKMGGLSFLFFILLLVSAALFTLAVAPFLVRGFSLDADSLASLQATAAPSHFSSPATPTGPVPLREWFINLIPANPFKAAADGEILQLVIATLLFAVAIRNVKEEARLLLLRIFKAVAETTRVLISYVLCVLPIAVFILIATISSKTGSVIVGGIGYFIICVSALLIIFTLLQYPIALLLARVPIGRFAHALLPAQTMAVSTRSSLASLPPLLEGAQQRLGLPSSTAAFVLPLSVSTFKLNRTISGPLKFIFLAHLYGVPLDPGTLIIYVGVSLILSFGSPGIPSGGSMVTLPFYLAAGIPVEGVVLLKAFDAIPDIFKTLLNVTADMTVAAIVTRFLGSQGMKLKGELAKPETA
jgi:Na+/H+-dicarboxylate symporter